MRRFIVWGTLFFCGSAFSQGLSFQPTAEETRCAEGVYCVEKMVCLRTIQKPPAEMHPDYYVQIFSIRSLKSAKNLGKGKKGLVDSLAMSEESVGSEPPITIDQAMDRFVSDPYLFGPPALIENSEIVFRWSPSTFFTKGFKLKIVDTKVSPEGQRVDSLVGEEAISGDVVADYVAQLECRAEVVTTPSWVVDRTKK